jgi:hypothetical protein
MPLETITHACGHAGQIKTYGNPKQQRLQMARAIGSLCPRCKTTKDDSYKKPSELPTLIGSQKQIEWAEHIRTKIAKEIKKEIKRLTEAAKDNKNPIVSASIMRLRSILDETSARRWIDNRDVWFNIVKGD